jgi:hypothetical protein
MGQQHSLGDLHDPDFRKPRFGRSVPKRVEVRDLNEQTVVKLATERKHLTDIIKMVAYQAESDLIALLRPYYAPCRSRRPNFPDDPVARGTATAGALTP